MARKSLFGGEKEWSAEEWTSSDDRVRGGSSQSYLSVLSSGSSAKFHGNLDIKTLGGAGFASQRTVGEDRIWDLSAFDGIEIEVEKADSKRYTFIIKDELLPKDPDTGREQSTISYEYDFELSGGPTDASITRFYVPWDDLKPTYRGKEKKDAAPLKTNEIRRLSIMMRSFFGTQEGDFSITIRSISAVTRAASSIAHAQASEISLDADLPPTVSDLEKGDSHYKSKTDDSSKVPTTRRWNPIRSALVLLLGVVAIPFVLYRFFPRLAATMKPCDQRATGLYR